MPSDETKDLIERADRLASAVGHGDADARIRFENALTRLRRSAGIKEPQRSGSVFEELVMQSLLDHDWIVAPQPRSRHAGFQPDFLVQAGDRVVLVGAKTSTTPRHRIKHAARELRDAVELFGADDAYLVVPDGERPHEDDLPVDVLTLSELRALT